MYSENSLFDETMPVEWHMARRAASHLARLELDSVAELQLVGGGLPGGEF